jgi:activator of HSP90 ATPase
MRAVEHASLEDKMIEAMQQNSRRNATTRRQLIAGTAMAFGGLAALSTKLWAGAAEGISRTAESIHQEPVFSSSPKRVYEALTDAKQFQKIVLLGAAMKSMAVGTAPAEISTEPGGAFSLFGGYLTGRQLELVPNLRIVQAWRAGSWDKGDYSIAKFVLQEDVSGTKIVFDHGGFPLGQAEHLAEGWHINYWEPLRKYLASQS